VVIINLQFPVGNISTHTETFNVNQTAQVLRKR